MMLQNTADQNDVVALRIGDQDYCLDIDVVRETRGWSPTTILPHAPAEVTGVIDLRGAVVDLSARLGLGKTVPTSHHVIVIVDLGTQIFGRLADVVSDILGVEEAALTPVPDWAADASRTFIINVIPLEDGRMLRKLDLAKILPRPRAEGA